MNQQDCTEDRGGIFTGLPCSEIDECKVGCCLPFCEDTKKVECSVEIGYGGSWQDKACKEVEECEEICCTPFYTLNTKAECEMLGGKAEDKTKCETKNVEGTLTIEIYHDNTCDCGSSEGFSCKQRNGITERLTATFMPDPNPEKFGVFGDYGNARYLIGEGSYLIAGVGEYITKADGKYTCHLPPAHDFKIPVIITRTTRDDLSGGKSGNVKMTISEEEDGFHFSIRPDFLTQGTKIRTFINSDERSSCSDPDENADSAEIDEDPVIEVEGSIPYDFVSDSLKGTVDFEAYPSSSYTSCGIINTGTITFNFEEQE